MVFHRSFEFERDDSCTLDNAGSLDMATSSIGAGEDTVFALVKTEKNSCRGSFSAS